MRSWPLVVLTLGGCAQLAGIEDTSGDGRVGVSLAVERVSIGSTVIRAPQDLSASTATYLLADPADPAIVTPVVATETTPGTWTAEIFDATPPVVFDLPDDPGPAFDRQLALPEQDLSFAFDVFEHPDPVVSSPTDTITVSATLDTPFVAETFELLVVGTWTLRGLEAPAAMGTTLAPPPFEIQTMTSLSGRPQERITPADTVLLLRRSGITLNGAIEVPPFDQAATNTLMGAFTTLALDQTLALAIDPISATTRLSAVRPAITAGPVFSWNLHASPAAEVGENLGPLLTAGIAAMTDTTVSAAYANPFAKGWPAVLSWTAGGSRTLTPDGQVLPVTLGAEMQQLVADPAEGLTLDFPAGVPEQISFGTQSLSLDNVQVPQPTAPVEISVIVNGSNATLFMLDVRELVPNATNDALVPTRRFLAISLEPTFVVQPEVFVVGKLYSLRVQTISGLYSNLAAGDLNTRALPVAKAFVDSGVFRVMP